MQREKDVDEEGKKNTERVSEREIYFFLRIKSLKDDGGLYKVSRLIISRSERDFPELRLDSPDMNC